MTTRVLRELFLVVKIFEQWRVKPEEYFVFLGLTDHVADFDSELACKAIHEHSDVIDRISLFISIYALLKLSFPSDAELRSMWMRQPNRAFKQKSPLISIVENGLLGVHMVRNYLIRQVNRQSNYV